MKRKIIVGSLVIVFLIICTEIPFALAFTHDIKQDIITSPASSYVDAIAYVRGSISDLEFDGGTIRFHAEHVFIVALASAGCSFIRSYQNQNISINNRGYIGFIGSNYIHVLIKTRVAGPI